MRKTRNDSEFYYCLYRDDRIPGDTTAVNEAIVGITVVGDSAANINYVLDEYGHETGERILRYFAPVKMKANVSPASGSVQTEVFGDLQNYDKVIVTRDTSCPIDENTVLFLDRPVTWTEADTREIHEATALFGEDEAMEVHYVVPAFDYIVRRVARSKNVVQIAVSKVNVS